MGVDPMSGTGRRLGAGATTLAVTLALFAMGAVHASADDTAFTVNRSKKEEWLNYSSTTANLTATAKDARTVVITSSVSDPKLPTMDVYILPKHVYSKIGAKALASYAATDGVGSGPFT